MLALPNKDFQALIPSLREKGFYECAIARPIDWAAYTQAQIDDVVNALEFIRERVDNAEYLSTPGKVGRPLTDPKLLAKAILLAEFLGAPERPAQGWTRVLGPAVGIHEQIDDRVLGDAYNRPEVLFILKQVFDQNKTSDGRLSGDGTGLETTRKQNYESKKKAGTYLTSIVDSREIVQAFDATGLHEQQAMHLLVKQVLGDSLRLDAGFNDRKLVFKIDKLGMIPYVFPKCNNVLNGSLAWKNMYMELFLDVMQWLTQYHLRSHSESFHSSFKEVYGAVTKRRLTAITSQITARIILHNRRRLSYFNKIAQRG